MRQQVKIIFQTDHYASLYAIKSVPAFDVRLEQPNKETVAVMLEAECITHDPDVKRYSDVEEALRELKR